MKGQIIPRSSLSLSRAALKARRIALSPTFTPINSNGSFRSLNLETAERDASKCRHALRQVIDALGFGVSHRVHEKN